jgi:hypothetical protein
LTLDACRVPYQALSLESKGGCSLCRRRTCQGTDEVPLLHKTLAELAMMRSEPEDVCDDSVEISTLTLVAAQGALQVYDKYVAI